VPRILIVDDDESDRLLLEALLTRAGYEAHVAENGQEALAFVREQSIDVVLTDLHMPQVHGLELISVLRDLSPRPGIVAVAGTGESQLDVAQAVGADAVFSKPITLDELLSAVRRALTAVGREPNSQAG